MNKPWKVILAFAGVFIAGAICGGVFAPRWFPHERTGRGAFGGIHWMDRLEKELDLTAEQKQKIAPIVSRLEEETRKMRRESAQTFRVAMDRTNAEIVAELTPEQRVKFEEMRKRMRERLDRFRGKDRERPPPPNEQH